MGTAKRPSPRSSRASPRLSSPAKTNDRGVTPRRSSGAKARGRRQAHRATFSADRQRLPEVCEFVRAAAADCGFDDRTSYACQLAVCEAVENIIQHGYRSGRAGKVRLTTEVRPGELRVKIVDTAPPFDPSRYHFPLTTSPTNPRVGGRGLLMIRRVMDVIDYERRGGQNVLRLTKNRPFTGV